MSYQSIILSIIGILNLILAIIVYLRNRKNLANFYYSMMVFSGSLWIFGLLGYSLSAASPYTRLLFLQLIYIFTLLTSFYYFIFTYHFPYKIFKLPKYLFIILYIFILLYSLTLAFKPGYLIDLSILNTNKEIINIGNYFIFSIIFLSFIISGIIILINKYKSTEGVIKKNIKYVLVATFLTYFLASITNLLSGFFYIAESTIFMQSIWASLYWLGPVFSLINFIVIAWVLFKK